MGFDAIGIASKDVGRTTKFYKILGVELVECGGPDHLEASLPSGIRIMVDSFELLQKINPALKEPQGSGITLCFKQNSPRKVDELHAQVLAAGFKEVKSPWDAFWGQRYSSVRDPDGNQIDLFAAL